MSTFSTAWQAKEAKRHTEEADVGILSLVGWCHYRLGNWARATRFMSKGLYLKPEQIDIQFAIALASMCSGRYRLGLENYQQGIEQAKMREALARRGLLQVARCELEEAGYVFPALMAINEVQQACELLMAAYTEIEQELEHRL